MLWIDGVILMEAWSGPVTAPVPMRTPGLLTLPHEALRLSSLTSLLHPSPGQVSLFMAAASLSSCPIPAVPWPRVTLRHRSLREFYQVLLRSQILQRFPWQAAHGFCPPLQSAPRDLPVTVTVLAQADIPPRYPHPAFCQPFLQKLP